MLRDVGAVSPSWTMTAKDAAELACVRRGVEPVRIVVLNQRRIGDNRDMRMVAENVAMEPMSVVL